MATVRPGLFRDQRGGVEYVLYVMLIAGIAMVALPGVRYFTATAQHSFEGSTNRFDRPGTYVGGDIQAGGGSRGASDNVFLRVSTGGDAPRCTASAIARELEERYQSWVQLPGNASGHDWVDRQIFFCKYTGLGMQEVSGARDTSRGRSDRGRPTRPVPRRADDCTMEIAQRNRHVEHARIAGARGCRGGGAGQPDGEGPRRHPLTEAENRACHLAGATAWTAICLGGGVGLPRPIPGRPGIYPPEPGSPSTHLPDFCKHPEVYLTYDPGFEYCAWNR